MRHAIALVLALAVLAAAPSAFGAVDDKDSAKAQFIEMGVTDITGTIKQPTNLYMNAKQKVAFERLSSLKKSFLPALEEDGKDRLFK